MRIFQTGLAGSVLLLGLAAVAFTQAGKKKEPFHLPPTMPYGIIEGFVKSECASCHNGYRHSAKVDLSSYKALIKSGVVVAKHPERSLLIQSIVGSKKPQMPYKRKPLSADEIRIIKRWVAMGAHS